MMTPALRALQKRYPEAVIDLLTCHPYVQQAFRDHPRLRRISCLPIYAAGRPDRHFAQMHSRLEGVLKVLWYYPDVLFRCVSQGYDVGINYSLSTEYDHLGNALLFALGIPMRLGTRDHGLGFLTHSADVDFTQVHRAEAYLHTLAPLDIQNTNQHYEFSVRDGDRAQVRWLLRKAFSNPDEHRLVVMHPGGKIMVNSRRWPAPCYVEVGRFLVEQVGARVVLLGGDDDWELNEDIAIQIGDSVLNLAGQLTFAQTGALLSLCDLCVTNDTATLHLAEAVGTPRVISIFGPTDPDRLAPRSERHTVVRSDLPCAPCLGSIINKDSLRCWRDVKEECLQRIHPRQVINVIREVLGEAEPGSGHQFRETISNP